ncbi:unnamed protein product [Strongylus vulgaris]|uniref:Runt domain-containing protein n=1 Tax=Strongylus vulgaris TaxID=40348 RepID=A0A3P7JM32_STRVU|nr:unnamed protein product [Strongylus vulgaris]
MSVYHNVHEFLHANKTPLMKSSSPNVFYTKLPEHHRSNKSLPSPFTVLITSPVPDGTIGMIAYRFIDRLVAVDFHTWPPRRATRFARLSWCSSELLVMGFCACPVEVR